MKRYIALLRGINVGKAKRVPMADLRALMEDLGLAGVRTLLNSGNAVFDAKGGSAASLAKRLRAAILDKTGVVTHIQEDAVPYSEAIIDSNGPVAYVIELNGGIVKKLGLAVGDKATSATISAKLNK